MEAKRVTQNNARVSKKNGKAFYAKHLDGPNGKAAKMKGLLRVWRRGMGTWKQGQPMETDVSRMCEGVEAAFYEEHFGDALEAQNAKHIKSRHKKRVKTMDEYRQHPDTCPESTLFYIGKMGNTATPPQLWNAFLEFLKWREKEYPGVVTLDFALHKEKGAPHIHDRHVWIAHDKEGREIVSQTKALEEMGVPRPDEAKYQADIAAARKIKNKAEREAAIKLAGLHNNAKMTYTAACREKFIEIARSRGFEIIDTPQEPGEYGLSQARYKARDEERKAEEARKEAARITAQATEEANEIKARATQEADKVKAQAVKEGTQEATEKLENLSGAIFTAQRQKAAIEQEIGDLQEYRAWRSQRDQERREAARIAKEEQEAKERQEAAREARESQERARHTQEARRVAEAAQRTPEESYKAAQAAIWGEAAPPAAPQAEPEQPPYTSALDVILQRAKEAAKENAKKDGPSYPGS